MHKQPKLLIASFGIYKKLLIGSISFTHFKVRDPYSVLKLKFVKLLGYKFNSIYVLKAVCEVYQDPNTDPNTQLMKPKRCDGGQDNY